MLLSLLCSLDWSQGSQTGKLSVAILFMVAPVVYIGFWACFKLKHYSTNRQVAPEPQPTSDEAVQSVQSAQVVALKQTSDDAVQSAQQGSVVTKTVQIERTPKSPRRLPGIKT